MQALSKPLSDLLYKPLSKSLSWPHLIPHNCRMPPLTPLPYLHLCAP